jgi:hypothetical protein
MIFPGFTGGSVPSRSKTINNERTVNLYEEHSTGTPKRDPAMLMRPSLRAWTYLGPGPVRALFWQDGRFFGVSGPWFYEIFQSRNVNPIGQVAVDGLPATISSNGASGGHQLLITSGGLGYIFDLTTGVFGPITDAEFLTPTAMAVYSDTFFVNLQRGANTFQLSDILDGTAWNGLDTGQTSLTSDTKVAIATTHRELWILGTKNCEVWYDSGDASFPYQPVAGVLVEHGIAAPYSVVPLDNTLYWLGQDSAGRGLVWRTNGYTPERISDNALEYVMQTWPTLEDVIAFAFQISGHAFYCLYSPHNDTTWVYDVGTQVWTEWAHWEPVTMRFVPLKARCAASGWNQIFLGDRQSGAIYVLSMTEFADDVVS